MAYLIVPLEFGFMYIPYIIAVLQFLQNEAWNNKAGIRTTEVGFKGRSAMYFDSAKFIQLIKILGGFCRFLYMN